MPTNEPKFQCPAIVESNVSIKMLLLLLLNAGCCTLMGWFLFYMVWIDNSEKVYENWWLDFLLPTIFVVAVCLLCLTVLIYTTASFKYRIVIDKSLRTLTYYSLLQSKGVALRLDAYVGYYTEVKTTRGWFDGHIARAHQEICYLVNADNCMSQLMSSISYRNYKELKEALGLPQIN